MAITRAISGWHLLAWALVGVGLPLGCGAGAESEQVAIRGEGVAPHRPTLTPIERLGKALFFDKNLSTPPGQSCSDCHGPKGGWAGEVPGINKGGAVYPGAVHQRFGNRKPPSSAYATLSPQFSLADGIFVGGNFWDGRATGMVLGNPAADQAMGPYLNPLEQNNASPAVVCEAVAASIYAALFEQVWGTGSLDCTAPAVTTTYGRIALSVAAYEDSIEVNAFSSKYDAWVRGRAQLSEEELAGMELFEGKGKCADCHPAPLFTDYTFDNLGVPRNPDNPFYRMDAVQLDGAPVNPLGSEWVDPGLGGFLADQTINPEWVALAGENWGKHKVPTLRNVDLRPGPGWTKAYTHNGVFKSLEQVVHYYNTRDVEAWPEPEVAANLNDEELGDLGLTPSEERAIVAFMRTLSDGYER